MKLKFNLSLENILKKYPYGQFEFEVSSVLSKVCNAPKDCGGVYICVAYFIDRAEIIYIGCSGKLLNDGTINIRRNGMFSRIVNGTQFDQPRYKSWPKKMQESNIAKLIVYWWDTTSKEFDIPKFIEAKLINEYYNRNSKLPAWNKEY